MKTQELTRTRLITYTYDDQDRIELIERTETDGEIRPWERYAYTTDGQLKT